MESASPRKFISSVLTALDVKPSLDHLENYNSLVPQIKRKHNPGSPDPRRSKRAANGIRSIVPGLETDACGFPNVMHLNRILSHFRIQSLMCYSHRQGRRVYPGIIVKSLA